MTLLFNQIGFFFFSIRGQWKEVMNLHNMLMVNLRRSFIILHNFIVCVCVCVCVCGHVYVVYEDTNLYNDMGMT